MLPTPKVMTLASLNLFDDVLMWYFLVVIPYVQRLLDFATTAGCLLGVFFLGILAWIFVYLRKKYLPLTLMMLESRTS